MLTCVQMRSAFSHAFAERDTQHHARQETGQAFCIGAGDIPVRSPTVELLMAVALQANRILQPMLTTRQMTQQKRMQSRAQRASQCPSLVELRRR